MTPHKCRAKTKLNLVCDEETKRGCILLEAMEERKELREQMEEWVE